MLTLKQSISPIRIIFLTAIVVLAALSVYSYKNNLDLIHKAGLVNHTNVVRFELQETVSSIKDAETGARAFFLTGLQPYLLPYNAAVKSVPGALSTLDSLLADNPRQLKNMQRLRKLSDEKFTFLKTIINTAYHRDSSHEMLIESNEEMNEINAHVTAMIREEDRLLLLRTQTLNEAVSFAPSVNVIIAGFAILLLVFSYFKITRELEKSNELQGELQASNIVLEKSNAELAQFAYVASHDLQEPLRKIQTFISRIHDTEQNLSEKGKDYFSRVDKSARRMQQLIRDILSYSRVDDRDNRPERTDLNLVLAAAKEQLDQFIKEKNGVINAGKLPVVNAVRYQFEQLFVNLLSNALKFAQPNISSVITISDKIIKGTEVDHPSANKAMSYHCISVADNGIGFEQQYGERIFKIFHRLNTKEAYEGNGIGLSIVKKIAEANGGFVSAEGEAGKGATFSVYLPA